MPVEHVAMSKSTKPGGRVLFLTSNYPRWSNDTTTPFVHELALDLVGLGWRVTVLAPHAPGSSVREEMDGVAVRRFRYLMPERAEDLCYGGGALVNLRENPRLKIKLPAFLLAEWAAAAGAIVEGVDVVHAHWALPQGFIAASTPRRRVPRVITVHGGDVFGLRKPMLDSFSRYALRSADCVTVGSRATAAAVHEIAGTAAKIAYVPLGVTLDRMPRHDLVTQIRARFRRRDGPLLVFVGRVVEEKGVYDIVKCVATLAAFMPGATAVIVGRGPHEDHVRSLARDCGVADRIALAGWADPEDVPSWFAAGDIVLAPSRIGRDGWTEGQGLSILEAMAVGSPVIATRTGGIPDTLTHGETGIMVPPSDPGKLADAVKALIADPTAAKRMGDAAAQHVRARFDRRAAAEKMDAVYRKAILQTQARSGRRAGAASPTT